MTRIRHGEIYDGYGSQVVAWQRVWEISNSRPYHTPLPFHYYFRSVLRAYDSAPPASQAVQSFVFGDSVHATNRCYGAMTASLGDSATWANNLLEAGESIGTIEKRAGQLIGAARAISKGHFGQAAKILDIGTPKGVSTAKKFGDNWLEYHFGWVPAVQDVGAAVNVLQKTDFGSHKIKVHSSWDYSKSFPTRVNSPPYVFITLYVNQTHGQVKMGATTRVTNPNAFLANQMGFVNPLSVIWEAVPYSFVVDWFTNVGQVLASMSDFVGVDVSDTYTTISSDSYYSEDHTDIQLPNGPTHSWGYSLKDFRVDRGVGLSGPVLEVKPFKGFSVVRAATAISLLLQHL